MRIPTESPDVVRYVFLQSAHLGLSYLISAVVADPMSLREIS